MISKKWNSKILLEIYKYSIGVLLVIACCSSEASTTLQFSATVTQGSCDIKINGESQIKFGEIDASKITEGNKHSEPKTVTVGLTNCKGLLTSALTPKLHITGTTLSGEKYLFHNTGAEGWGFLISNKDSIDMVNGTGLATSDTDFNFAGKGPNEIVKPTDTMVLHTAVSCGSAASCAKSKAGEFSAAVQLEFRYK